MKLKLFLFLIVVLLGCSFASGQNVPGTLNYPTSLDNLDTLFRTADRAASTLTSPITSMQTTIPVLTVSGFPSSGAVVIDNEVIYYTGKSGNSLTGAIRGRSGTTAASHLMNAAVRGSVFATHHNTQSQAILNLQTKLGVGSTTPVAGSVLRGTGTGVSAWGNLVSSDIPNLDAAKVTTGIFSTARLGTGTANASVFLRGDGSWAASGGGTWGSITGTLSAQTDLQSALDAKLSSLTVGTTATNATAGSVFFAGTSGVFQQDNAGFFWDDANNKLLISGTQLTPGLHLSTSTTNSYYPKFILFSGNGDYSGYENRIEVAYGRLYLNGNQSTSTLELGGSATGSPGKVVVQAYGFASGGNAQQINTNSTTTVGQMIKLSASQTANAFEVRNSSDALLFTIDASGAVTLDCTITAGGTTGNQTINKTCGTVNIAAGNSSVTVTNSLISANSILDVTARTNDATCYVKNYVASSGSVVFNMTAACTGETSVGFAITSKN